MAVEQNKRKRKHEATDVAEEAEATEEVVPKKQLKKSLTPKKNKSAKDEKDSVEVNGIEVEEQKVNFSKDFKMMEFRNKLRGNNFITGSCLFVCFESFKSPFHFNIFFVFNRIKTLSALMPESWQNYCQVHREERQAFGVC